MTRDVLAKAKELAQVNTRIRVTDDLTVAKRSPNLVTLGHYADLKGLPTLTPAQIKTKANSLTTLTRALTTCRKQSGSSWPSLTFPPPPKSSESMKTATPTLQILTSRKEVESWLDSCLGNRTSTTELVLDIETHGDVDVLHPAERPLVCVGLFHTNEAVIIPSHLLDSPWPDLIESLKRFDLIAHNGKFDLVTLCSQLGDTEITLRLAWDTMLMHYVLWPAAEQGLKVIAKQILGVDDWETFDAFGHLSQDLYPDRGEWYRHAYPAMLQAAEIGAKSMDMTRLGDYHPLMVQLYNAYDVYYTWHLWQYLSPILAMSEDSTRAYNHLVRFSNWIQVDEADGFPVDLRKAGKLRAPYAAQSDEHRRQLIEWAHAYVPAEEFPRGEFNPNSWQQVMKLYERVGVKLKSTSEDTMSKLVEKGDQFAAKLLEYRSAKKLLGTYLDAVITRHNSIHGEPAMFPSYRLAKTVTGRLSSSGVTNIQNWPTQEDVEDEDVRLRSVYVPSSLDRHGRPQERLLTQVDYSQAELRVAAALSGDTWLTEIFSDPSVDIFTQMTQEIFPQITDPEQIARWRRPLKSVVYGLLFSRGAHAIAVELGIPVDQAQMIINRFLMMATKLDRWRQWIMKACVTGEALVTRFGRHFQHEVVTNRNKASVRRSALSFLPQSTASDLTLLAYMDMRDWLATRPELDWRFRALVHDAITWDTPADEAEQCGKVCGDFMIAAAKKMIPEVPFAVDAKSAKNWAATG